ncbi:MAG: hypothetical protein ABIY50_10580 [Ignavibacteria bacterium]
MTKVLCTITYLAVSIWLLGCTSSENEPGFTFGTGKYKFNMSDSSGTKLAEGTLNVSTYDKNKISGTYTFTKVYNDKFPGYSSMDGAFGGDVNSPDKIVFMNTNPRIADSNVFWKMRIRKDGLSGGWYYSVFRGQLAGGLVKITK